MGTQYLLSFQNYLIWGFIIMRGWLYNVLVLEKHMALIQQLQEIDKYYSVSIFVQICSQ